MSEWCPNRVSVVEEILSSSWLCEMLGELSRCLPFSFWLRADGILVFGSNGSQNQWERRDINIDDLCIEVGISPHANAHCPDLSDPFIQFLSDAIMARITNEEHINAFSAELLDKYEEINLFYQLTAMIGAESDLDNICKTLLEKIDGVINGQRISIMLFDRSTNELIIVAARGFDISQLENHRISLKEGISGYVLRRGEPLVVKNKKEMPKDMPVSTRKYKSESFVSAPMICSLSEGSDVPIGVINVTEKRGVDHFTSADMKLLTSIASIASIAIHNSMLIERVRQTNRLEKELEIAETIQLGLLPGEFPSLKDLEIAGQCRSAKKVGGDYFDFVLTDESVNMIVADVSGHNVSAALMMAMARSVLRAQMQKTKSVSQILHQANKLLFEDMSRAGFFISIFLLRYNRITRKLTYSNGGHHPVLWHRAREKASVPLDAEGLVLGVLPQVEFEEKSVVLEPGDLLVMYTDGIVEATDPKGRVFGIRRLKNLIKKSVDAPPKGIIEKILQRLDDFNAKRAQTDDFTIQILKIFKQNRLN